MASRRFVVEAFSQEGCQERRIEHGAPQALYISKSEQRRMEKKKAARRIKRRTLPRKLSKFTGACMAKEDDKIRAEGVVVEALPGTQFRVRLDNAMKCWLIFPARCASIISAYCWETMYRGDVTV